METHIESTMYGDSFRGYNVRRHIDVTEYGDSYRWYNIWRLI